jgi:hypothetical protein
VFKLQSSKSILFITLDSCRYDTFLNTDTPNLDSVGSLYKAFAPGNFTYSSHMAMFSGFTPGVPQAEKPIINPKWAKLFRMSQGGVKGIGAEQYLLDGRNIIDGFKRLGYRALGTGAVGWFNPDTETSRNLVEDFDDFFYPGNTWSLQEQLHWIAMKLSSTQYPIFLFLNIGETHVPYYHYGAEWTPDENPCVPFAATNDRDKCIFRQRSALEFVDCKLRDLLLAFAHSTVLVCADHGDCWGEDGLWEHGIHHEKVFEVPLIYRLSSDLIK